jgi:hypothetical protein
LCLLKPRDRAHLPFFFFLDSVLASAVARSCIRLAGRVAGRGAAQPIRGRARAVLDVRPSMVSRDRRQWAFLRRKWQPGLTPRPYIAVRTK